MIAIAVKSLDVIVTLPTDNQHSLMPPTFVGGKIATTWIKGQIDKATNQYGEPLSSTAITGFDLVGVLYQLFGRDLVFPNFKPEPLNLPN